MGENNDSFFDKILLKNIDREIQINVNFIDTFAKISPSATKTGIDDAKTASKSVV